MTWGSFMRRWNGWGSEDTPVPEALSQQLLQFLEATIGAGSTLRKITLTEAINRVSETRVMEHPLMDTTPETRLRHARGQSLPDWLAMRSGDIRVFPDAVAKPKTVEELRELLREAHKKNLCVIPYGGGTSVVGHINPVADERPILTINMGFMDRVIAVDRESQLITIEAGATGPRIEKQLANLGFRLGHYPQSWEYSTIGGWVASRSSGQQSLGYGRIEQLFAGARVETLSGRLEIPSLPASAAGLDMREVILGSEGRMGIITDVTVRVSQEPELEYFETLGLPSWEIGVAFSRDVAQQRIPLSMLRLSNPLETASHIAMNGNSRSLSKIGIGNVLVTYGITGSNDHCLSTRGRLEELAKKYGISPSDIYRNDEWASGRFKTPHFRDSLGDLGYAADTMETAVNWSRVKETAQRIEKAISEALSDEREKVLVYSHLSHIYPQGSSIYTTYIFRMGDSYECAFCRWQKIKKAGAHETTACGGTISHQHGVGMDHIDYLPMEKGDLGIAAIRTLCNLYDPRGQMNPNKLLTSHVTKRKES